MFCFIWRCLHVHVAPCFSPFFAVGPSTRTRGGQSNLLVVPPASTARSAKRLTHAGAIMWNRLPPAAKGSNRYLYFKSQALQYNYQRHKFSNAHWIDICSLQPTFRFLFVLFFSCIYFSTISFNILFTVGPMLLGILPVLTSTINKVYNNNTTQNIMTK